jgi:hypothetical protein
MPNPFEAALSPDRQGTLGGFLGGVMGVPTGEQRSGAATGRALQELSQRAASGMSPQAAVMDYLKTPQGMQEFASNPNLLEQIKGWQGSITPSKPEITNASPGSRVYSTDSTGTKLVGEVPTTGAQEFSRLATIANLPPERLAEIAAIQLMPPEARITAAERAIQRLKNENAVDSATADKLIAGALKVVPLKDKWGQDTGQQVVIDLTNPNNTVVGGTVQPPRGAPAGTPNPSGPGTDPKQKFDWTPKNTMFLGAGVVPNVASAAQGVAGQFGGDVKSGREAAQRQTFLTDVQQSLVTLRDGGAGLNIPKIVIDKALANSPNSGLSQDPATNVQKGIDLWNQANGEVEANEATIANPNVAPAERVKASQRAEAWKRVQRSLPSLAEMQQFQNALADGTIKPVGVGGVAKDVVGAGKAATKTIQTDMQGMAGQPDGPSGTPKAPGAVEATKVINGKTYQKIGGRWYE